MAGIRVTAHVLRQHGYDLYLFPLNSLVLKKICYVSPRSKDNPEEVQRILLPKRAQEIGEYIQKETSLLPNAIVVSLTQEVKILPTGEENTKTIEFPGEEGKYAYILDGQHRLAGFEYSGAIQYDLPVVAIYNAHDQLRGKIFADINSKQVKVTDVHLLSLYYQIRELPSEEAATMNVVMQLAEDQDSPLYRKIKMRDDDKGCWVTNKHFKICIAPHAESGGVLYNRTGAEKAQIIKEYLKGVKQLWPDQWGNNKDCLLTRPIGVEIIMSIFEAVKHRCDLNEGREYTAENFENQLQILKDCNIELPYGAKVPLDWHRGPAGLGTLSNKAGKALIRKHILNMIREADEEK